MGGVAAITVPRHLYARRRFSGPCCRLGQCGGMSPDRVSGGPTCDSLRSRRDPVGVLERQRSASLSRLAECDSSCSRNALSMAASFFSRRESVTIRLTTAGAKRLTDAARSTSSIRGAGIPLGAGVHVPERGSSRAYGVLTTGSGRSSVAFGRDRSHPTLELFLLTQRVSADPQTVGV
jgi:hypothetical protein